MSRIMRLLVPLAAILIAGSAALAEERIALVVGNGSYSSVTTLDNPVPDADLIAGLLADNGFDVTILTDVDQISMNRAIAQFGRDLRTAGPDATGLFYYAGHAVQSFGENYLLPVDAALRDAADLSLVAVEAQAVLRQMRSARNKTNIVILDACRNNPFVSIPDMTDNGLAEMNAPTGSFLSYSTAPGAVALDGLDGNSPFTKALAEEIEAAGVPIEQTFKNVRVKVIAQTSGQQTPWDTSSLTGDFFFVPVVPLTAEELQERQLWNSVKDSDDPVQIMLFLRGYPGGHFQHEARELLAALLDRELGIEEPEKPEEKPATPTPPGADEQALFAKAQASGAADDYRAYLDAFPKGVFAELAALELGAIKPDAAEVPLTPDAPDAQTTDDLPVEPAELAAVTFTSPFTTGGAPVQGHSIAEIIEMTPLFPPIDGLPDAVWKDKTCSNCHSWSREPLCVQGKTYVTANNERALSKVHPFGGVFKQALRSWAAADCP